MTETVAIFQWVPVAQAETSADRSSRKLMQLEEALMEHEPRAERSAVKRRRLRIILTRESPTASARLSTSTATTAISSANLKSQDNDDDEMHYCIGFPAGALDANIRIIGMDLEYYNYY